MAEQAQSGTSLMETTSGSPSKEPPWRELWEADFPGRATRQRKGSDYSPGPTFTPTFTLTQPVAGPRSPDLLVLLDEAPWFLDAAVQALDSRLRERGEKEERVAIWAASGFRAGRPESLAEVTLSRHFRCPPAVVREATRSYAYAWWPRHPFPSLDAAGLSAMPHPTEGPAVKRIDHRGHPGAQGTEVWQCPECGREVARFLLCDLQIRPTSQAAPTTTTDQEVLQLSDVLISGFVPKPGPAAGPSPTTTSSSSNHPPMDFEAEAAAQGAPGSHQEEGEEAAASGFLRGLQQAGVDYADLRRGGPEDVEALLQPRDVDVDVGGGRVQVARPEDVLGLERPVVVALGPRDVTATYPRWVDPWFDVLTRCTAQLVLVGAVVLA